MTPTSSVSVYKRAAAVAADQGGVYITVGAGNAVSDLTPARTGVSWHPSWNDLISSIN